MKSVRILMLVLVVTVLASCAPRVRVDRSVEAITNTFTATIGGQTLNPNSGQIQYSTSAFDMYFQIDTDRVNYFLQNKGSETLRVIYDESAFVLPDGRSVRAIPDTASYVTRNDPQPPTIIPPAASSNTTLLPADNLDMGSFGLSVDDIFGYPNRNPVSFRLVLAVDVGGQRTTRDITFSSPAYSTETSQ